MPGLALSSIPGRELWGQERRLLRKKRMLTKLSTELKRVGGRERGR